MSKDKLVISHWLGLTMQHFLYSDRACNNMRSEYRTSLLGLFWLIHMCRDSANIISWLQWVHKNTANCIACWQCAVHPFLQTAILILQLVDFHTWSTYISRHIIFGSLNQIIPSIYVLCCWISDLVPLLRLSFLFPCHLTFL